MAERPFDVEARLCQDVPYRRTTDCRAYDSEGCPKTCWYAKERNAGRHPSQPDFEQTRR